MAKSDSRPTKATSGPRRPLTRERILRAALRLIDERGRGALTMRRLGADLDVEAMSLYKHVKNKDDVIRGAVELVHSELSFPDKPNQDWQSRLYEFSRERRANLMRHQNMMPYLLRYGGESSEMQALTERALECVTLAAHHLLHLLTLVVLGSAILDERERPDSERVKYLSEEHPLQSYFRSCDGEVEFEFGLRLILREFGSRLATES
jgi:AcrR family transcriptional regulator